MRTGFRFSLAGLLILGSIVAFGDEIDRLLVAVNGKVITEGDLRLARNLNALVLLGKQIGSASRDAELNRLVDLELLRQELENFSAIRPDPETVEARMDEMKQAYAEIGGLPGLLRRLGLQEAELRSYVALQDSVQRFIDFRFRPFVTVAPEETRAYYQEQLIPELRKMGSEIPSLESISGKIEEILTEQKLNSSLERWLQDIRRHSRIEFFVEAEIPAGEAKR